MGGLCVNVLEFIVPGVLMLLKWDAYGERFVVKVMTIGVVAFGVVVSVWCTVASFVYILHT